MKTFLLIISLLTNDGELKVYTYHVERCPDNSMSDILALNQVVSGGDIKSWIVTCVQDGRKT